MWSKNPEIWLVEKLSRYNSITKIFPNMGFVQ